MIGIRAIRQALSSISLTALALGSLLAPGGTSADGSRFDRSGELPLGQADWVSMDEDLVAFGSGRQVFLAEIGPVLTLKTAFELDAPVSEVVLAGSRLYLNGENGRLSVLDLEKLNEGAAALELSPRPSAPLHIARMDDYLLVAEDGYGLRILTLPPPPDHLREMFRRGLHHQHHESYRIVGTLAIDETFRAVTASVRSVYLAVEGKGIVVIDASQPATPAIVRQVPTEDDIRALAANGPKLYTLGPAGLTIQDLSGESDTTSEESYPEVQGSALYLAGRAMYLAGGGDGLITLHDLLAPSTTHFVTVSDFVFSPANLAVNVGDTVQWDNVLGFHNVESCDGVADPLECVGVAVEGSFFLPGGPSMLPWTFQHTFNLVGGNPYFCVVHVGFNMVGDVTTAAAPPPAVPALLVGKITPDGSRLNLAWNPAVCGSTAHHVIFGLDSGLPTTPGGTYALSGGVCGLGASPFSWSSVPGIPANQFLWFLMLANDGSNVEGSWGVDSLGGQRDGGAGGGSSGQCGIVDKNLVNGCGL